MAKVFGPLLGLAAKGQIGGAFWFGCTPKDQVIRKPRKSHGNNQQEKAYQEKHNPKVVEQRTIFQEAAWGWDAIEEPHIDTWLEAAKSFISVDRCKLMSWPMTPRDLFISFYLTSIGAGLPEPLNFNNLSALQIKTWKAVQQLNYITKGKWVEASPYWPTNV